MDRVEHCPVPMGFGMVIIDMPTIAVDDHASFAGTRKSSCGAREQGFVAARFYTRTKAA